MLSECAEQVGNDRVTGCWLAMKAHAPIYIAKQVWEACSSQVSHPGSPSDAGWAGAAAVAIHTPDGTLHSHAQRPEELDPIQLMRTIMCVSSAS